MTCSCMQVMQQLIKHGPAARKATRAVDIDSVESVWMKSIDCIAAAIPNVSRLKLEGLLSASILPGLNLCFLQCLTALT